jgi:hypothetical protein
LNRLGACVSGDCIVGARRASAHPDRADHLAAGHQWHSAAGSDDVRQCEELKSRSTLGKKVFENLGDAARANGVFIVYTLFPGPNPATFPNPVIGDTLPAVAPKGNEPVITAFLDKFILGDKDTGLEKMLKDNASRV